MKFKSTLAAVVVVGFIALVSSSSGMKFGQKQTKQMDVMKGVELQYSGTNGKGIAEIKAAPVKDYETDDEAAQKFIQSIAYKIEPNENLKNGQTVEVEAVYNDEFMELASINPVNVPVTFTVEGLHDEGTEEKYDVVSGLENLSEGTGPAEIWRQGEEPNAKKKKDKEFRKDTYNDYANDAFDSANEYGRASSQLYTVMPIVEDLKTVGYKTVFKEDS